MDAGRFTDAVAIVGPLVERDVVEANTLFLYGLAVMRVARQADVSEDTRAALLDQAISAFHKMLVEEPQREHLAAGRGAGGAAVGLHGGRQQQL